MPYTLTTPLFYVNDKPHLGSTYTTIACDALARFNRYQGHDVIFITGVDEHGQKIERSAEAKNISPQQHCDEVSQVYQELWANWSMSHDRFVRTSSEIHTNIVNSFFDRINDSGDIYMGRQQGWYCIGCEEYKDVDPNLKEHKCELHQKVLEWKDEENLFFRLSRFQTQIESLINREDFIFPESRRNEIKNFVKQGLRDFSISRVNLKWGIPVPGYSEHTFYVWFDALVGYLTALFLSHTSTSLDNLGKLGWPASVHMVGKDILRFHAVYWPAMLLSAGLPIPNKLFGHGFLTREGQKMGKSLGNIIDPAELISTYGSDPIRWYLLRDIKFGSDGDFQKERLVNIVNNDLANIIGNLLNRTLSMSRKWFDNGIPLINISNIKSHILASVAEESIKSAITNYSKISFHEAAESILNLASASNIYLNESQPWKVIRTDDIQKVSEDIYCVLESTRIIGILLAPIVPELSSKIMQQLSYQFNNSNWTLDLNWGLLVPGNKLPEPQPILNKLD